MESPMNSTLLEAKPSLESVIGGLSLTTKEVLNDVFEQKQVSTAGILRLLPKQSKTGPQFASTLSSLTKIFNQYGVVVKYITASEVSYTATNNITIVNPRAVISSIHLPKSLIGIRERRLIYREKGEFVDYSRFEGKAQLALSSEMFIPEDEWFLKTITRHKILSKEDAYSLIGSAQLGDTQARNILVMHNQKLVVHIANMFKNELEDSHSFEYNDLVQEGTFGLYKAIEKFDRSLNWSFSTYAYWWVYQSITRALHNLKLAIRIPVHMALKLAKFRKIAYLIETKNQTRAELPDVAEEMNLKLHEVVRLENLNSQKDIVSLDSSTDEESEEGSSLGDFIPDAYNTPAHALADQEILKERIKKCLSSYLSPKEYEIVVKRFGLFNEKALKLREIGDEYDVTRERIRQIEKIALEKIKSDPSLEEYAREFLGKD